MGLFERVIIALILHSQCREQQSPPRRRNLSTAPDPHTGYCQICGSPGGAFPCPTALANRATQPMGTGSSASCCKIFGQAWEAYKRTLGAASDRDWGQRDALSAVILAAAAAEAFINELAELARQEANGDTQRWPPPQPQLEAPATAVMDVERGRGSTSEKFAVAIEALTGQAPDLGRKPFQDLVLLMRAKDGLMHAKLDVRPTPADGLTSNLPSVVKQLRSKNITAMDADLAADDALSTRAVARWACASAAAVVQAVIAAVPSGMGGARSLDFELKHFEKWFTLPPLAPPRQAR
jgi:hypothetical protein